jgi:bifunctional UDP-N-acetylglucosamine pyrophosphorylase/glucosamine-1-phosphate N-acetyltransferase
MRSGRHKVLHHVAGRSMLWHVLTALLQAGIAPDRVAIVVGESADEVRAEVVREFGASGFTFALQAEQRGTGHATLAARSAVPADARTIVVAYGDTPLLQDATVRNLLAAHASARATVTLVTGTLADPYGYGRLVRDGAGHVAAIVEERDATAEQRAIREVNSGFCAFDAAWLWQELPAVAPAPNGEIYLTSLAARASAQRGLATLVLDDVTETVGVNTRGQLAAAEATLRARINARLLEHGVTLQDPATTYVDATVEIGPDTTILANTHLRGATRIGPECEIGPNTIVRDSAIAGGCRVLSSVLDGAVLEEGVVVGPFAHLRPGTHCGRAAEIGTGSEIKGSSLGPGVKMHHFGYLGDATVEAHANVGAGTITCNFDGERKHPTRIGESAFVGSGTLLVAPVAVGAGALTGAGAVVLHDVAAGARVAGVPARPIGRSPGQASQASGSSVAAGAGR